MNEKKPSLEQQGEASSETKSPSLFSDELLQAETEEEFTGIVDESRDLGRTLYDNIVPNEMYQKDVSGNFQIRSFNSVEITPQGDIFGDYKDVKSFLQATGFTGQREMLEDNTIIPTAEAHHLIPQATLKQMNMSTETAPSVGLWAHEHVGRGNGVHTILTNMPEITDAESVKEYYVSTYNDMGLPEWGERVTRYIDSNKETINNNLGVDQSSETDSKATPNSESSDISPVEEVNEPARAGAQADALVEADPDAG